MSLAAALAFASAACATGGLGLLRGQRRPADRAPVFTRIAAAIPARLRPPLDLAGRIEAAGSPGGIGPGEMMAVKVLCGLLAAPLAAAFGSAAPGRLGLVLFVAIPASGFFAPDLWLRRRTRARIAATRRDLPGLLDLLRVAVDAGMAPTQALKAVGVQSDSLVARELVATAAQVELGVPLSTALDALTRRLTAPELRAFTAALRRAATHGAPLSDTLAAQARDARLARRRRIEEEAAKAAPKIQLVVALLLVPSVLLLVAAALASALLSAHGSPLGQ